MSEAARTALISLAHCAEPADPGPSRLVARHGPEEAVALIRDGVTGLRQGDALLRRLKGSQADGACERAAASGARIVTRVDREWPTQLADLGDVQPFALWVAGAADLRLLALRSVAMVGARACTAYGEEVARSWAADLGLAGWCILSGGAYGIDAAAHRGALAADATTICVLAGGVDMPYPRAHDALIARIADEGLVVSESPLGEAVRRQRFLSRNRIIAALTRATVVIEAALRSGTIATARAAHAMNRPVLAAPGPVTSPASAGCHRMVRDGEAVLVSSAEEVLDVIDFGHRSQPGSPSQPVGGDATALDALADRERRLLDALPARGVRSLSALVAASGITDQEAWAALGELEAAGWVSPEPEGWRLARLTRAAGRP